MTRIATMGLLFLCFLLSRVSAFAQSATPNSTIQFSAATYRVSERGGTVVVTVTRSGPSSSAASVDYSMISNGASAGIDFVSANGALNWAAGDAGSKAIEIQILQDDFEEEPQDFLIPLTNPTGAILGAIDTAQVIIEDPSVRLEEIYSSVYGAPAKIDLIAGLTAVNATRVEFYQGNTLVGMSSAPGADGRFVFTWDNIPRGVYTLRARAFQADGSSIVSPSRTIMVSGAIQGAGLTTAYVDQNNKTGTENGSAARPFTTIQKAVDNTAKNGVVKVALGTFRESVFVDNNVLQVIGGFLGGRSDDYASGPGGDFVTHDPADRRTSVIPADGGAGFALYNAGDTRIERFAVTGAAHGFFIFGDTVQQSFPKLRNNVITQNGEGYRAATGGGIEAASTSLELVGNEISFNKGGRGGGVGAGGNFATVNIRDNIVRGNIGYDNHGGGLYIIGSGVIAGNLIVDNEVGRAVDYGGWGGGLIVFGNSSDFFPQLALSNNIVTGNLAGNGSAEFFDEGARATVEHELIFKNRAPPNVTGGAIYTDGCCNTFISVNHCTVVDNEGVGLNSDTGSSSEVRNSIFWNNSGGEFGGYNGATVNVSYTLSDASITTGDGIVAGPGNRQGDPLFANSAANDYHVKSTRGRWSVGTNGQPGSWSQDAVNSPAIDAADPTADFSSETLPNGSRADLGLYGNRAEAGLSFQTVGGNLQVIVDGANGKSYVLERSDDLVNWFDLTTLSSQTGQLQYTDLSPSSGFRFYRVRQ